PGGFEARREGAEIRIGPSAAAAPGGRTRGRSPAAELPGDVPLRPGIWTPWPPLACRVRVRRVTPDHLPPGHGSPWRAVLSPRLLQRPLSLRGWRPGDRFRPLGMSGEKKLQDFFVDAKVPRQERGRIPLLFAGDRIAWVVGHRIAEDFRFRGRGTACLVEVEFSGGQPNFSLERYSSCDTGWARP
ncbi:MAG: tRNA lysidine(34) synthetase TilS, partial [candidate division NC10 bacterium]|nr:tRNA lysidine(34) synthetase TilS [candidate division NC10 bacterium]